MKIERPNKLRNTIVLSFCLFALVLTILYGVFVFLGMRQIEDKVFTNQLQSIVDRHLQGTTNGSSQLTLPGLSTYVGTERMPIFLFDLVGRYPLGYHEVRFIRDDRETELQFAIEKQPGTDNRIYFVYDVSGMEISEKWQNAFILLLVLAGIIVSCLGVVVGVFLASKFTNPLSELTRKIDTFSGDDLPTDLIRPGPLDEIGFLGYSLEQANERVNQFIVREKEFTRNASHELRTPLTVIKGAAELLTKRFIEEKIEVPRALKRIDRASQEMKLTIDTFLMLAREDNVPHFEEVELGKLCGRVVDDLQLMAGWKNMSILLKCPQSISCWSSPQVLRIILSNLLRNAIEHSTGTEIVVKVTGNELQVTDNGGGIASEVAPKILQPGVRDKRSTGTGFGLSIVNRICTRLGWTLEIDSSGQEGTIITVIF